MKQTYRPWRFPWFVGVALLVASVAGSGYVLNNPVAADGKVDAPGEGAARPATLAEMVAHLFGLVDVEEGVSHLAPVQHGRVTSVPVKEGQKVKAGQVLLTLDDELARLNVSKAEADLNAATVRLNEAQKLPRRLQNALDQQKSAVEAAQEELAAARGELERGQDQVRTGNAKDSILPPLRAKVRALEKKVQGEQAKLDGIPLNPLFDPKPALELAKVDLAGKQAALDQAKVVLKECRLLAPDDGIVLRVLARKGDVFGPQSRGAAVVFCPAGPRIVRAEVEQEFAGRVREGQEALVRDDMDKSVVWKGKVTRIASSYMPRRTLTQEPFQPNDVRTLEVIIALEPGKAEPRLNQRVSVTLTK